MAHLNRREFLNTASSLTAGGIAAGLAASVYAADDVKKERPPIKLAIMGVNSRGKQLLPGFVEFPEVEIGYICDPDSDTIPSAVKIVTDAGKSTPRIEKDFRVALDDPSVTALVCSAPDHWHALAKFRLPGRQRCVRRKAAAITRSGSTRRAAAGITGSCRLAPGAAPTWRPWSKTSAGSEGQFRPLLDRNERPNIGHAEPTPGEPRFQPVVRPAPTKVSQEPGSLSLALGGTTARGMRQ